MNSENLKEYWFLPTKEQDKFLDKAKRPVSKSTRNPLEQVFGRSSQAILRKVHRSLPRRKTS